MRKERPILFSAPMVRAILEGRKTQTRRVVKPVGRDTDFVLVDHEGRWLPYRSDDGESTFHTVRRGGKDYLDESPIACPYGKPGDRLWVRETFQRFTDDGEMMYKADAGAFEAMNELKRDECAEARWRPAIHMPRWASRITLEVTDVRVERLQDISDRGPQNDCTAEGVFHCGMQAPSYEQWQGAGFRSSEKWMYRKLWESINGPGSWDKNPWVWVIEFRRVEHA